MDIKKVQVVMYATRKRLQGYHLLKNSRGASPYEVNMIRHQATIDVSTCDLVDDYRRISRDFSQPHSIVQYKNLYVSRNFENDKNTTYKNIVRFFSNSVDRIVNRENKSSSNIDRELLREMKSKLKYKQKEKAYFADSSRIHKDDFIAKFLVGDEGIDYRPKRPSFWTVLKNNLKNGTGEQIKY